MVVGNGRRKNVKGGIDSLSKEKERIKRESNESREWHAFELEI